MLLLSIKLKNFRQFREGEINFADGKDKRNVTIILGDNGSGKTTFAQAFSWCLYGTTTFQDKILLNRIMGMELLTGQSAKVSVTLRLIHGENTYKITREQEYIKDSAGNIKPQNTVFDILRMDKTGNTVPVKATMRETEINSILPKELSRYFFFDGERIDRMSKDITDRKKAEEFADAVRSLLGLKGIESAIRHLAPTKGGVINSYESTYDASSNSKIAEYTRTINECNERIEKCNETIEEMERQMELAETQRYQKTEELKQYEDGEKLQRQREDLQKKIAAARQSQSMMVKSICDNFLHNFGSFMSVAMIQKAMKMLQEKDFTGKDIPHMHQDTIYYLLKNGYCICGTQLMEGSVPYNNLRNLIDFLPPKSLSATIGDFKKSALRRVSTAQQLNLLESTRGSLDVIDQQEDEVTDYQDVLQQVEAKLSGESVQGKVKAINAEIKNLVNFYRNCKKERDNAIAERANETTRKNYADSERSKLALLDEKNKKTEIYKAYAEAVYQSLSEYYKKSEKETRDKLQQTINDLFVQIYEGGLSLTIDDHYHVTVLATDFDTTGKVEASTAQSISVIFAFIAGIIKMARENRNASDENMKLLASEPYPLVMDAPLSAFDKRRIETVCTTLPEVAEQIIIFIKDTDGDLAEEHMGDRIGSRHRFEKLNEFETQLS